MCQKCQNYHDYDKMHILLLFLNLSPIVKPKLTNRLVWDVKIQNFLFFFFSKLWTNLNCIYCPNVMLESTFKLLLQWYDHCLIYYILYILTSQLHVEWPIIMTKQLLIIREWCSHIQTYQINPSVKLTREPKQSVKLTMKLSGCSSCSVQLSWKPELNVNMW